MALPDKVKPYVATTLAWDNTDRLEETLTGRGTLHWVNVMGVQSRMFGPDPPRPRRGVPKNIQRTISIFLPALPVYAARTRYSTPTRSYVEAHTDVCADAL